MAGAVRVYSDGKGKEGEPSMKATELLKKQHRSVHGLFGELKKLDERRAAP